jgi:hypothetical protein|eukprot:SAG25_NODE_2021_length_2018_cov_2.743505_5_plen_106_part_00
MRACSDAVRAQLAPHLPEGTEPTAQAMADLLRSPQFSQATQNLTQVLPALVRANGAQIPDSLTPSACQMMASGAGGEVMQQFGISGVQGPHSASAWNWLHIRRVK